MILRPKGKYPNLIPVRFDYWDAKDTKLEKSLFALYNVPVSAPCRAVFIGDDYLLADDITEENLRALVEKYSEAGSGTVPPWKTVGPGETLLELPAFLAVIAGGLAVVVFFVYIAYLRRRENRAAGVSFPAIFLHAFLVVQRRRSS